MEAPTHVSYTDIRNRLDDPSFVLSVIMSEIDLLLYKTQVYNTLASKTKGKRATLSERIDMQMKSINTFPEVISRSAQADPVQLADAYAILAEESIYTLLRNRIKGRYRDLVHATSNIKSLRSTTTFDTSSLSRLAAALRPGVLKKRQEELIVAVDSVELRVTGDARRDIREHLYGILLTFANNPRAVINTLGFNYMIMGPPGTGKSHLAHTMAQFFSVVGVFVRPEVFNAKKPDLVAAYVGQSAGKTRRYVYSALDAVFFIDEAYNLVSCEYVAGSERPRQVSRRDQYGLETVDQLVDMMTELKGLMCIIVAGYPEEMQVCFLKTNPGLERRFAHQWILSRYSRDDLLSIFERMLHERDGVDNFVFSEARKVFSSTFAVADAVEAMRPLIFALDHLDAFPNQAGDIEKLSDMLYALYSKASGGPAILDHDLVSLTNQFLGGRKNSPRIHTLTRAEGVVHATSGAGVAVLISI